MTANWSHGPIYCSSITGSLVLQQIRVNPEHVVKLPMNEPVNIEGIDVTLIDANQSGPSTLRLIVVVLDQYCFYSRRRWENGYFGYYTVVTFELRLIMLIILPFEESILMQCISTPPISSCNPLKSY
jgi:hypothetical protein